MKLSRDKMDELICQISEYFDYEGYFELTGEVFEILLNGHILSVIVSKHSIKIFYLTYVLEIIRE